MIHHAGPCPEKESIMKWCANDRFRSPSLVGLGIILLVAMTGSPPFPTADDSQDDRTAPELLNADEVSRTLNDGIREQLQGLELEADGVVKVVVDVDGQPVRHWLTVSTGYEALDRAIGEAVAIMKFKPASVDGKPVSCVAEIPVAFRPDGADVMPKAGR